ncbi:hypothetical protein JCM16358_26170 [Halanaerocella petrolearia]
MDLDNLFALWPVVVVLWGLVSKFLKKLNQSINQEQPYRENNQEIKNRSQREQEVKLAQESTSQPVNRFIEEERLSEEKLNRKLKQKNKKKKLTNKQSKSRSKPFGRRQVMQGIIFKEVLDKPRSKKPHPIYRNDN